MALGELSKIIIWQIFLSAPFFDHSEQTCVFHSVGLSLAMCSMDRWTWSPQWNVSTWTNSVRTKSVQLFGISGLWFMPVGSHILCWFSVTDASDKSRQPREPLWWELSHEYLYSCSSFTSCRCSGISRGTHPQKSLNIANTINEKLFIDVRIVQD